MTINDTWGYNRNDRNYKSAGELIRTLVEVASKGGTLLLNVGPTPEGTIQPEFEERLLAVGSWLRSNGEAIYGTTYGPWQDLTFGKTTAKDNTIYLHVFEWPQGELRISGVTQRIAGVTLLSEGRALKFNQSGSNLTIVFPSQVPDPNVSVLAIDTNPELRF